MNYGPQFTVAASRYLRKNHAHEREETHAKKLFFVQLAIFIAILVMAFFLCSL